MLLRHLLNLLNHIIKNSNNESLYSSYNEYDNHIVNFDKNIFALGRIPTETTYDVVNDIYFDTFTEIEGKYGKSPSIKDKRSENWNTIEAKIKVGFGINSADNIIMYFDKTFFNSAKEGFALGREAMYIKDSGKPLMSIKHTEIYCIESNKDGLVINTTNNNTYYAYIRFQNQEAINDFASAVDEYVKGIQLLNAVAIETDDIVYEDNMIELSTNCESESIVDLPQNETLDASKLLFCFHCGNKLLDDAIFCSKCGTKVKCIQFSKK